MNKTRNYIRDLNMLILANISFVKKRLQVFPIKTINGIKRIKLVNNITVQGKDYDSVELFQLIKENYRYLERETKASSYTGLIRGMKKEIKTGEPEKVWKTYQKMMRERTEEDKGKMYFCLDAVKALTKAIKNTDSE